MKPSIAEILRRIRPLPPVHKAAHLRGLIASEPRRSIRRVELEAALKEVINKQLGREIKADKKLAS
jgi:hypothetical protein